MKHKKLILTIGSISFAAAPLAVSVSCSSSKYIRAHKVDTDAIIAYNKEAAQWEKDFPFVRGRYQSNFLISGAFAREDLSKYKSPEGKGFYLPSFITSISDGAFFQAKINKDFVMKGNVASIAESAFKFSVIPAGIKFPNTITTISDSAFDSATINCDMSWGDTIIQMGTGVFAQSKINGNFSFAPDLETIPSGTFDGTVFDVNKDISFDLSKVIRYNYASFRYAKLPTTFKVSNKVVYFGRGAFSGATFAGDFKVPGSITSIDESTFENAHFNGKFDISEMKLETIPSRAFAGVVFKDNNDWSSIKTIGLAAFEGATFEKATSFSNAALDLEDKSFNNATFKTCFDETGKYIKLFSDDLKLKSILIAGRYGSSQAIIKPLIGATLPVGFKVPANMPLEQVRALTTSVQMDGLKWDPEDPTTKLAMVGSVLKTQ